MLQLVHTEELQEDLRKGLEVAKIPGQKAGHDDISKPTRDRIMSEIKRAQDADHCTETKRK